MSCTVSNWSLFAKKLTRNPHCAMNRFLVRRAVLDRSRLPAGAALSPSGASSSSYLDGHIDDLAAQVGNVLANVFGTELVCRTVEILRQLHADVVRAWLRAP